MGTRQQLMNRRNVLIGLGGLTIGGGALFGTGAFSQVQAERTVTVNTSADGSAQLVLEVASGDYGALNGSSGDTIAIDTNALNLDAITTLEAAFTISPTGSTANQPWTVDILDSIGGSSLTSDSPDTSASGANVQFVINSSASTATTINNDGSAEANSGEDVVYDLVFNLLDITSTGNATTGFGDTMIVEASSNA